MSRKPNPHVETLVNRFLLAQKCQLAPKTWEFYRLYLRKFAKSYGHLTVNLVTPTLAAEWMARHYGHLSPSSRFNAGRSLTRLFHWAVAERLISEYPLKGFRKPSPTRRESLITPRQYAALLHASHNNSILAAVKFLYHTGCRPQEMRAVRAEWVRGRKIVMPVTESKGRKKNRVIYLDDMALRLVKRASPRGPIFRTPTGKAWTANNLILAIKKVRKRAKVPNVVAYTFRHSFITRQLEKGTDVATVAALAGNTPAMIWKHYSHVAENEKRLLAAL